VDGREIDALLVPGERDLADEVCVRSLEAVEATEDAAEPHDAALAANAVDAEGLAPNDHLPMLRERHEPAAEGVEAFGSPDRELLLGLVEALERSEQNHRPEPLGRRPNELEKLREEVACGGEP
jgi:hypothetical protein